MIGGVLFLAGALIMTYNLWRTARGEVAAEGPQSALQAAE
jgi:cytochrome c oxidase cbb3-type subunit 1